MPAYGRSGYGGSILTARVQVKVIVRALVEVWAVGVEPIAAAAGLMVVQARAGVIVAGEPVEEGAGTVKPGLVLGHPIGLGTRLRERHRFDGLLVESGAFAVARQPAAVTN